MKNYFNYIGSVSILLGSLSMVGCNSAEEEQKRLNHQRDSLVNIINTKDSAIDGFITSVNEIENNLATITQKETIVSMDSKGEMEGSAKDRINEDIKTINNLMDENRKKIAELNEQLRRSGGKIASLNKMLKSLTAQLAEKEKSLSELRAKLDEMNATVETLKTSIDTLNVQSEGKSRVIADQTNKLNTAYYTVGNFKDLEKKKILNKEGGFLGLGKGEVLKKDFSTDAFTKVDVLQVKTIAINSKKAKLVTSHPTDSYKLEMNDKKEYTNLVITDPEKFWRTSKYLVVVIN